MPLSQMQARDRYIIGSFIQFLDRNVKQAYDVEAAATGANPDVQQRFTTPLTIRKGKPDDITIVRVAPSIAVSVMQSGESDRWFEVGTTGVWRHRHYMLMCYPALDSTGAPCDAARELLRSYVQDAFEGVCIKVLDYSNPSFSPTNILYCPDTMFIEGVTDPIDRGATTALAQERHKFSMEVHVKYAVSATLFS